MDANPTQIRCTSYANPAQIPCESYKDRERKRTKARKRKRKLGSKKDYHQIVTA